MTTRVLKVRSLLAPVAAISKAASTMHSFAYADTHGNSYAKTYSRSVVVASFNEKGKNPYPSGGREVR